MSLYWWKMLLFINISWVHANLCLLAANFYYFNLCVTRAPFHSLINYSSLSGHQNQNTFIWRNGKYWVGLGLWTWYDRQFPLSVVDQISCVRDEGPQTPRLMAFLGAMSTSNEPGASSTPSASTITTMADLGRTNSAAEVSCFTGISGKKCTAVPVLKPPTLFMACEFL